MPKADPAKFYLDPLTGNQLVPLLTAASLVEESPNATQRKWKSRSWSGTFAREHGISPGNLLLFPLDEILQWHHGYERRKRHTMALRWLPWQPPAAAAALHMPTSAFLTMFPKKAGFPFYTVPPDPPYSYKPQYRFNPFEVEEYCDRNSLPFSIQRGFELQGVRNPYQTSGTEERARGVWRASRGVILTPLEGRETAQQILGHYASGPREDTRSSPELPTDWGVSTNPIRGWGMADSLLERNKWDGHFLDGE
jgi:hypothetical protein